MSSKVDRELAEIEARRAAAEGQKPAKTGVGASIKRFAKDVMLRRHSTKR